MSTRAYKILPGSFDQGGVRPGPAGVNFCTVSRCATRLELLLFDGPDATEPFQIIELDPKVNRTFVFWHVLAEGLPGDGVYCCWRADGPCDTQASGRRYDTTKALLDPWAKTIDDRLWDRRRASEPGDNLATAMRSLVVSDAYDWEGDTPSLSKLAVPSSFSRSRLVAAKRHEENAGTICESLIEVSKVSTSHQARDIPCFSTRRSSAVVMSGN